MYVFISLLSIVVISALYTMLACRQWPWVGHCFWFLQLQRRESFLLVGFVCWLCFFSIVLLCRFLFHVFATAIDYAYGLSVE